MNTKNAQKHSNRKKEGSKKHTYSTIEPLVKTEVLGVGLTNATNEEVLEYLLEIIENTQKNIYVVTPNPEIVLLASARNDFKEVINNADLALTDGMQLYRAAHFLGVPLKERIIGTDLVERVCEKVADWPITVGFLGAGPKVAEKASERLLTKYPKLKINFVAQEWSEEGFAAAQTELSSMNNELSNKKEKSIQHNSKFIPQVDILFVAYGALKQEFWMAERIQKVPVRVMIGVGGALDQIANPSLRPPVWVHQFGLGWLYRLIREPWRIKRQVKLIQFVWVVIKEKFSQM